MSADRPPRTVVLADGASITVWWSTTLERWITIPDDEFSSSVTERNSHE